MAISPYVLRRNFRGRLRPNLRGHTLKREDVWSSNSINTNLHGVAQVALNLNASYGAG